MRRNATRSAAWTHALPSESMRTIKVVRAAGAIGVLATALLLGAPARPALADAGESITTYQTAITVQADGAMRVSEKIAYDFGANSKHGIFRKIPVQFRYDATRDRVYPIDAVAVTMDGSAVPVDRSSGGGYQVLKIGDPNHTITGTHTYVIGYTVKGALNHFADHEELYWNVVGNEWQVPIAEAEATITGPATVQRTECFAGPTGSRLGCAEKSIDGVTATFGHTQLGNGSGLSVVVAFPAGSVRHTDPILDDRHDLTAAFQVTPATVGSALGLALAGVAGALAIGWLVGRDRRYVGPLPGLTPEPGEPEIERRKPLIGAPPVSVEFVPPENVRPGQVGTLIDERANVLDVTATIIDFAVRRHLHITELPREGRWSSQDWELTKLTDGDPDFLPYERKLFDALFHDRDRVRLSELKNTFAADLRGVRGRRGSGRADRVAGQVHPCRVSRCRAGGRGVGIAGRGWQVPGPDRAGERNARAGPGLPAVRGHRRGGAAQVPGAGADLLPVPAVRHGLRVGRTLGGHLRPHRHGRCRRHDRPVLVHRPAGLEPGVLRPVDRQLHDHHGRHHREHSAERLRLFRVLRWLLRWRWRRWRRRQLVSGVSPADAAASTCRWRCWHWVARSSPPAGGARRRGTSSS